MNYSNDRIYRGLIDLEPNTEEIVAAAEQQELQKRKQAAKFLVNDEFRFSSSSLILLGRISIITKETC